MNSFVTMEMDTMRRLRSHLDLLTALSVPNFSSIYHILYIKIYVNCFVRLSFANQFVQAEVLSNYVSLPRFITLLKGV